MKIVVSLLNFCLMMSLLTACGSVSPRPVQNNQIPIQNLNPPINQPAPVTPSQLIWSGELNLRDAGRYRNLLQHSGVCNRWNIISFGTANCKAWDDQAQASLSFQQIQMPSQATLTIRPILRHWSVGSAQSYAPPVILQGRAQAINDFEGFQIRLTRQGFGVTSTITAKSRRESPHKNSRTIHLELYDGSSARSNMRFATADLENATINEDLGNTTSSR